MLKQTLTFGKSKYVTRHLKGCFGRKNEYINTKPKSTRPRPHDVAESEEKDLGVWGEVDEKNTEFKSLWYNWFHS